MLPLLPKSSGCWVVTQFEISANRLWKSPFWRSNTPKIGGGTMDFWGAVGAIGGLAGIASAFFSWSEWKKTNRKIAMLNNASKAAEILPAWYTSRMMQDYWLFGLLTTDGNIIAIIRIESVSDDGKWMDVTLAQESHIKPLRGRYNDLVYAIADDRTDASIQISTIVAALELQSS